MVYLPSIPQPTDNISTSQGQLLGNFTALDTIFGYDHYAFSDATLPGQHKFVKLPTPLGADPAPAGDDGEIYSKQVAAISELFYANATTISQLTGFNGTNNANGAIKLPSGLILKWGTATVADSGTVTFAVTPAFTTLFQVIVSIHNNGVPGVVNDAVYTYNETTLNFQTRCVLRTSLAVNPGTIAIKYIAIGV